MVLSARSSMPLVASLAPPKSLSKKLTTAPTPSATQPIRVPTTLAMPESRSPMTCRTGAISCRMGAISPSSWATGGRIACAMVEMTGMSGTRMSLQITVRICVMGGSRVPASRERRDAKGGRRVERKVPTTGIRGPATWKTRPRASQNTGSRSLPSCTRMGTASDNPPASRSTSPMSMGSMVGHASMMVLNSVVRTGVNFAPALARKSAQIPLTPFRLLV